MKLAQKVVVGAHTRPARILILGGDSDYNLGDRAILAALCHCLTADDRDVELTITSTMPRSPAWRALPGVTRVLPRGARATPSQLRSAAYQDLVVIGGGGLFQDDDSRAKMPYWLSRIAALRAMNRRIVAHCIGAGPLRHPESIMSGRLACNLLESVSVRDEFAQDALSRCATGPLDIVPDPAFMLPPAHPAEADRLIEQIGLTPGEPIIGVALRRWFHRRGGFVPNKIRSRVGGGGVAASDSERAALTSLLDQLADTLRALAGRLGASVLLMPTYNVAHEADSAVTELLKARLGGVRVRSAAIDDPRLYKAVAGRLTLMLSARMHPLILSASMGVPIVGLAYNPKFAGLFRILGLPERMLWLDGFRDSDRSRELQALALQALEDRTDLKARTGELAARCWERTAALAGIVR